MRPKVQFSAHDLEFQWQEHARLDRMARTCQGDHATIVKACRVVAFEASRIVIDARCFGVVEAVRIISFSLPSSVVAVPAVGVVGSL